MKRYNRKENFNDFSVDNVTDMSDTHYTQPLFDYSAARKAFMDRWDAEDKRRAEMGKGTQGVPVRAIERHHELELLKLEE